MRTEELRRVLDEQRHVQADEYRVVHQGGRTAWGVTVISEVVDPREPARRWAVHEAVANGSGEVRLIAGIYDLTLDEAAELANLGAEVAA